MIIRDERSWASKWLLQRKYSFSSTLTDKTSSFLKSLTINKKQLNIQFSSVHLHSTCSCFMFSCTNSNKKFLQPNLCKPSHSLGYKILWYFMHSWSLSNVEKQADLLRPQKVSETWTRLYIYFIKKTTARSLQCFWAKQHSQFLVIKPPVIAGKNLQIEYQIPPPPLLPKNANGLREKASSQTKINGSHGSKRNLSALYGAELFGIAYRGQRFADPSRTLQPTKAMLSLTAS